MKLGVLKTVADEIPALLYAVCGKGDARRGPKDENLKAANERISHMGRLILATLAPPGYLRHRVSTPSAFLVATRGVRDTDARSVVLKLRRIPPFRIILVATAFHLVFLRLSGSVGR